LSHVVGVVLSRGSFFSTRATSWGVGCVCSAMLPSSATVASACSGHRGIYVEL
jgi:hypothetical protein